MWQDTFELTAWPVPVIVLFTKFDALLAVAMSNLFSGDRQLPREEKVEKAQMLIDRIFEEANIWGRLTQLNHAPKYGVRIKGISIQFSNK